MKLVAFLLSGSYWLIRRRRLSPASGSPVAVRQAVLSGLRDPIANAFYLTATRLGRLDIAVVLTSLYPAVTVLLFWLVDKEKIAPLQWLGIAFCLAAIVLVTL